MARKARQTRDASSDDDAPEVVPHSTSKADAKRDQKTLHDFEAEEKVRRKARNRERDQKLKERARVTRAGKTGEKVKVREVRFLEDDGGEDDVEARMLRAMRDAVGEVGEEEEESEGEFKGLGREMDLGDDVASDSDSSSLHDEMSLGENESIDSEAQTDDEDESTSFQAKIRGSGMKADYLADDLFAAAFASTSQSLKPAPNKKIPPTRQETVKKRRRKSAKDLVVGGRTIRTLPRLSDPRSQATARTVPSARVRRFLDHSLAMKGKQALLKAKKKGWERRPANVGVMKYQGAPHGFARSTR